MARRRDLIAYAAGQAARTGWYLGHYVAAARLAPRVPAPAPEQPQHLPGIGEILADLGDLLRRDWRDIAEGRYLAPFEGAPSLARTLSRSRAFFADLPAVNLRRRTRAHAEVRQDPRARRYPRYYQQNFHFQSDGYLSRRSAALYDFQVEVLFMGGADAMRRRALVPIGRRLGRAAAPRLLDVACGTGHFLGTVKANFPGLWTLGVDLSRPYLDEAATALAGHDRVALVEANAERLPLADAAVDAATCIFLFHELPRAVRAHVAAELARVLRPGGLLVFIDSIQRGDRPGYEALLDRFPRAFHEPYYGDYVGQDLNALFGAAGFRVERTELAFFAKVLELTRV